MAERSPKAAARPPAKKAAKSAAKSANAGKPARPAAKKAATRTAAKAPGKAAKGHKPEGAAKPTAPAQGPPSAPAHAPPARPPAQAWIPLHPPHAAAPPRPPTPAPGRPPARAVAVPLHAPTAKPFDPATGAWLPADGAPVTAVDPAAYRKGATRSVLLNVLLGIVLGLLALNFLAGILQGIVLVFAPDSAAADEIRDSGSLIDQPWKLALLTLAMFVMVGVVPFAWVLGTRVVPWEGTKRYLGLRATGRDWVRGFALVPLMLIAVIALSMGYVCATEGCGALDDPVEEETGVDTILDNLTWPIAILVALCAGIGEEILFRGVLQRWIGVWGQAVAFGLAHAGNGYPPQVLFAFGLGIAFGYLYKRGWSLVTLIVAHAAYDLAILSIALLFPELA